MFSLTFCLMDLSISDRGGLKSPAIIVDLSVSPVAIYQFCLMYFDGLLMLGLLSLLY